MASVSTDQYASLPAELKQRPQWVLWRRERRDEKITKVPYNARTGKHAKSDDPSTWSTFEEALEGLEVFGENDGIGFVFSEDDELVGVDLDACSDDGETLVHWAQEIVTALDSYTEFSQSRKGAHTILKGKLPAHGRKKGPIEVYESRRFFAMTGYHVPGTPLAVRERGEALLEFHRENFRDEPEKPVERRVLPSEALAATDWDVIDRIRKSPKWNDLWIGRWEGYGYPSASEADLALIGEIAYYAGPDAGRIDRIFRQSGKIRPKWDSPQHGRTGSTYGADTIQEALSNKIKFYDWRDTGPRPRTPKTATNGYHLPTPGDEEDDEEPAEHPFDKLVFNGPALLAADIPDPEWLVPGLVAKAVMTMLVGIGKIGKSVLAHQLCVAGACGGVWLDQAVPAVRVLYVNWEDPLGLTRARAVQQFAPTTLPETYHTMQPPWGSSFRAFLEWLEKFIPKEDIGLVVIDPLAIAAGWRDENDNAETGPTLRSIQEIAVRTGAAIPVVHHTRKAPGEDGLEVRGGSAIFAGIQGFLSFRRKGEGLFELQSINKMPGEHGGDKTLYLKRTPHTLTWHVTDAPSGTEAEKEGNVEQMIALIQADPGITREELGSQLGVAQTTVRRYLKPLTDSLQVVESVRMKRAADTGRPPMGLFYNKRSSTW